jgi:xylulokinase
MDRQDSSHRRPAAFTAARYVLAIDLGSGSHKAALVADTGEVVASAEERIDTRLLPGGGAEQDPMEWWNGAKRAARSVIEASGIPTAQIVAVACDSQWSVVVPVDEHAEPLMNAVHWMDTRGGKHNRRITHGFPAIQGYGLPKLLQWIRLTGLVPTHSGVDSLGHTLFIKHERPHIYARTFKFLEPMDFLTARLTGKITATQKTMAPFVLVDNRRWGSREYSRRLLHLADLDHEKFPELLPNDAVVGPLLPSVAAELGLSPSTQVVAGINDSNATAIGSGAVADFDMIIYIGTTLYMTGHVPFKKTDLKHFMTSLPSPFRSRYILLGEQGTGGKCVEFFLDRLVFPNDRLGSGPKPQDAYERFDAIAAEAPPGSQGLIFLPWLNGSVVPSENPFVRGAFFNLSLNTTRSHMARSIMEALAYNNRWTRGPAEKFIGRPIDAFRFSGGGALSDLWGQIHADVLGTPIQQIEDPLNSTVRGTALLALVIMGHRRLEELPSLIKVKQVFEPDRSRRAVYDKMYAHYRALFERNKKIYAALNAG